MEEVSKPEPTLYGSLKDVAPDKILVTAEYYREDKNPDKMFLSIGAYRDANGKPYVLSAVKKAEDMYQEKLRSGEETKEYDSIDGFRPFCDASVQMLLGPNCPPLDHIASAVSLSGTGALTVAAQLLRLLAEPSTPVYVSNPTWPNHQPVFRMAGFEDIRDYRYYLPESVSFDFNGMMEDLMNAPEGSIVIYHLCGHNPTGIDPTKAQWKQICNLAKRKRFFVLFDSAYQGYASGDLDSDAYAARLFAQKQVEFICTQSYAKNMGLYGDRLGCIAVVCNDASAARKVRANMKAKVIRALYSNPPRRPSRVAHLVLTDPDLRREWETELQAMAKRIRQMRQLLYNELMERRTPGKWGHILTQIGMFSYTGLTKVQCNRLTKEYSIYLLDTGRISIAGLTKENTPRLAKAIHSVLTQPPPKL